MRVISNAFRLAHIAARHHIQPVAIFSEPHRSRNRRPALAKCDQRNVFLPVNLRRNRPSHANIVASQSEHVERARSVSDDVGTAASAVQSSEARQLRQDFSSRSANQPWFAPTPSIDPALSSVLKAFYAQMDARALAAPQEVPRRYLWPIRSPAPATGLLRCGPAARSRARYRLDSRRVRASSISSTTQRPAAFPRGSVIRCSV